MRSDGPSIWSRPNQRVRDPRACRRSFSSRAISVPLASCEINTSRCPDSIPNIAIHSSRIDKPVAAVSVVLLGLCTHSATEGHNRKYGGDHHGFKDRPNGSFPIKHLPTRRKSTAASPVMSRSNPVAKGLMGITQHGLTGGSLKQYGIPRWQRSR